VTPSSLPSRGATPQLSEGVTVNAEREVLHGIASQCTLVECTCGEVLPGATEAQALADWERHCTDANSSRS
jgi:hypothetical protein